MARQGAAGHRRLITVGSPADHTPAPRCAPRRRGISGDDAMDPLYLDYNATTPLDPRVFEAMRPHFLGPPRNAGSRTHVFGQRAKSAVEHARQQVADLLGVRPEEI